MRRLRAGRVVGTLVVPLVFCVTVPGSSAGNPPSSAAAPAPTPRLESVVVTLRDAGQAAPANGRLRRESPGAVKLRLRAEAESSQRGLLQRLADWRRQGEVSEVRSLWISNAVAVTATPSVLRRIAARPDVASVQPDTVVVTPASAPSANQVTIGSPTVWAAGATGQGVVVATLDSGVDPTDPDLAAGWRGGSNSWFDPYGQHATPYDATGHGTGVLGVLAGGSDTGTAVGTAPGATWIAARVYDDAGAATLSGIHAAFQWLLDPDGNPATDDAPDVVNASWVLGTGPSCNLELQPDVQALRAAGILPVFAAGNFGSGASSSASPANYPESLSVGAVSGSDLIRSDSSRGPSSCGGRTRVFPDLVAPGTAIPTLDRYGLTQTTNGTSVAAPHAAGALALLLAAEPALTPDEQAALLTGTAVDLGAAGPDEVYGAGRLDVAAAYAALPQANPDFTLGVSPASATVAAGSSVAFDLTVGPVDGFAGDVDLSAAGLPAAQGTAVVVPATVTGGSGTATVTVSADAAASTGVSLLTVTASSGQLQHQVVVSLSIEGAPPPPADQLQFSTVATGPVPGVGDPDDADVYGWDGAAFHRRLDATAAGVPSSANVDGLVVVDDGHYLVSFATNVVLPGLGKVQDEDVVELRDGAWTVFFDGTSLGLTASGADLDAVSLRGGRLYFSTRGNVTVPGVYGTADNADVYSWDGRWFAREWQATAHGVPASANVDGLVWTDQETLALSFANRNVRLPGLGKVQDEDVVGLAGGSWSVIFDGGAHGLDASDALDIDAFDLR